MKFQTGDKVYLKANVSDVNGQPNYNSNKKYLENQRLVVDHYSNNIDAPYIIMCKIDNGSLELWPVTEDQIE